MDKILKGEIPFVRILIPFITGISFTYLLMPSLRYFLISSFFTVLMLLLLAYFNVFYKKHNHYRHRWLIGLLLNLIIFFAAYNLTAYKSQLTSPDHFSKSNYEMFVANICSEPKLSGDVLRFEAEVEQGYKNQFYPLTGKLLIALKTNFSKKYRYGDLALISSSYSEVEPAYNPGEFNYKSYLANHRIYQQTFINDDQVRLLKHDQANPFIAYAFKLREKLVVKFNNYISDKDAASVASTLILGYRSDLSKEVLNAYSKTGTMHVLSVSGMHVGIVFIIMLFLLKFMDSSKKLRLMRAFLMIGLIWFYAIITGFSPSACRSALMISFVIIGKAIQRSQNTYNLLAISAVLLLIYDPFFLFDAGFQLSYLAVLGLVYLYPKIYNLFYIKNRFWDKIWDYTSLSTAAQLATFPLSMYYFHQFPVYFLLSNLFIILPVGLIMYAGLLFLFVPWDILLKPLGWLLNQSIVFTNRTLFYIENLPFANISGIWINTFTYLLIYLLILVTAFAFLYRDKRLVYSAIAIVSIFILSRTFEDMTFYRQNQIIFYTLRKNSAIGFFEGRNSLILTDLNQDEKTFTYAIQPSIDSNAVEKQKVLQPGMVFSENNFYCNGNFIQFRDWRLLIWTKIFDKKTFSKKVSVQVVLLQRNPEVTVEQIRQSVDFNILLIDASNMDYRIKKWEQQAIKHGINYYVLKKNPAYILNL